MTTNQNSETPKKGSAGKFLFGASLGALIGVLATKSYTKHQDKIDKKFTEVKEGTVVARDKALEIGNKTSEVGGVIADTSKTVKAIAAKTGRKIARDTMKANVEIKKATKKGIDQVEKTIKNA